MEQITKALISAQEKYLTARKKLEAPELLTDIGAAAQEANDAWLAFKRIENEAANYSTMKKLGDLYGC